MMKMFFRRFVRTCASLLVLIPPLLSIEACAADAAPAPLYQLEDTEVLNLPRQLQGRSYQVFVSLPAAYAQSKQKYPVLFVADANYAFPVTRALSRRLSDHGRKLQDFILVGLSYAQGDTPTQSRNRDYTPAQVKSDNKHYSQGVYGQSAAYRQYLAQEILPFVLSRYRIDPKRKVFAGHSYGAVLGVDALLHTPELFDVWLLGSPSLWFNNKMLFDTEKNYAAKNQDMKTEVYWYAGALEAVKKGDPRYSQDDDIVADVQAMHARLAARKYPGLRQHIAIIPDEDHLSVNPVWLTRALRSVFAPQAQK
ncbi:alpha/beta hydrolase-fold protein [Massilia sp. W12]|uniref:alpha/beta hydrolase n=1 Tax=Massilia sp. W12 TaxID=3126507 RepID=UPI0030CBB6CB